MVGDGKPVPVAVDMETSPKYDENGIVLAPAPWTLKGRNWSFAVPPLLKDQDGTFQFPPGFAAPYLAEALLDNGSGTFIGGSGVVQVVRYIDSPVGPYDELIYAPGSWKYADGSVGARITRIYVSTKESTANGRRNWNIPKQVAKFHFEEAANNVWHLAVSDLDSDKAFFKATVTPITLLSAVSIPFNTRLFGAVTLAQPPILAGLRPEEVATQEWCTLQPGIKGKAFLVSASAEIVVGGDKALGDGEGFPAVKPRAIAFGLKDGTLEFGEATWKSKL